MKRVLEVLQAFVGGVLECCDARLLVLTGQGSEGQQQCAVCVATLWGGLAGELREAERHLEAPSRTRRRRLERCRLHGRRCAEQVKQSGWARQQREAAWQGQCGGWEPVAVQDL